MGRVIWMGVGAVGGIYAYRKGQQGWQEVRSRGVVGTAAAIASGTSSVLNQWRDHISDREPTASIQQLPPAATVSILRIEGGQQVIQLPIDLVRDGLRVNGDDVRRLQPVPDVAAAELEAATAGTPNDALGRSSGTHGPDDVFGAERTTAPRRLLRRAGRRSSGRADLDQRSSA